MSPTSSCNPFYKRCPLFSSTSKKTDPASAAVADDISQMVRNTLDAPPSFLGDPFPQPTFTPQSSDSLESAAVTKGASEAIYGSATMSRSAERIIQTAEEMGALLDASAKDVDWVFQTKMDAGAAWIQTKMNELRAKIRNSSIGQKFEAWFCKPGVVSPKWYVALGRYLSRLPFHIAKNILLALCSTVVLILYTIVHPMKSLTALYKNIGVLMGALQKAETWTSIGAGIMGMAVGQMLIPANPLSIIGLILGGLCMAGGMGTTLICTIARLRAEHQEKPGPWNWKAVAAEIGRSMKPHIKAIPEAFLTGLILGVIRGVFLSHPTPTSVNGNFVTATLWGTTVPGVYSTPIFQSTLGRQQTKAR